MVKICPDCTEYERILKIREPGRAAQITNTRAGAVGTELPASAHLVQVNRDE